MFQKIMNTNIELKESFDLDFLKRYDDLFAVFDKNDSGNISFGVEKNSQKYFIKFAGCKTINYKGNPLSAIEALKNAEKVYKDLECDTLIKVINTFETQRGFGMIFEWVDGENMFPYWTFDEIDRYNNPRSPYYKFRHLEIEYKMEAIDKIFKFLILVNKKGYIAVDFYDGSLMYDFDKHIIKICDVDLFKFARQVKNIDGEQYWGSPRIKSPEESKRGAIIDSRSNIYNLGKTIHCLVGNEFTPNIGDWELSSEKYNIVEKSLQENPNNRYNSIEEFYYFWKNSN